MVVDFEEALRIVDGAVSQLDGVEEVGLLEGLGRVLAEEVRADRDQPGFDRATRDGFAVRAGEMAAGVRVVGEVRAGESWRGEIAAGCGVAIMTGAPVPEAMDAVVMVEHVSRVGDRVELTAGRQIRAGENVVSQGSEARVGDVVVARGVRVGAAEVALAAACGVGRLRVYKRVRVAIVATGDELVEVAEVPGAEQIRNSNSYAIAALVTAAGGEAVRLGIARDVREEVRARVREGLGCDVLVLSGGVSMGEYDLVEEVLAEFGAEFLFTGVKMQPGKPVVFGRFPGGSYFFGLPGNPVSTQVTFTCFVEMFLRGVGGEVGAGPRWAGAVLGEAVEGKAGLTRLLPARRTGVEVWVVGWQGSGDLAANGRADCYVELLPGRGYSAGEMVRVLLR